MHKVLNNNKIQSWIKECCNLKDYTKNYLFVRSTRYASFLYMVSPSPSTLQTTFFFLFNLKLGFLSVDFNQLQFILE